MVVPHGSFRFLRNLKHPFGICIDWPILRVKYVHSIPQKSSSWKFMKKPVRRKPTEEVHRENVVRKVYFKATIRSIYTILKYSTWDSAKEQLEDLGIRWDSYTVNQVLKTHPPLEKAWLFFNWASEIRGFKHDQYTYTTMLDIFGEATRISSMKYLFKQMQEKGIKIDVVTYTSVMHWLSNDGDVDGAMRLWEEMKDKGCNPTVVSYTAYMKILFSHNREKEAAKVYKEMIESGCPPNCYTYTVLMDHLAGSGKFSEALDIFSNMQETGVYPDKATCNILIEKCCKAGETQAMTKILQYMKENCLVLREPVFRLALETLKNAGKSDILLREANRHFSVESNDKYTMDDSTTDADKTSTDAGLVLNFLNRQNFAAVDRLLADMMEKNVGLCTDITSEIIEVYCVQCRVDGAILAFEYSMKMGIKVKRNAYLSLVGLFIRTNSFPKVLEVVQEMVRCEISLGTNLNALLIYRLGCARKADSAAKVFDLLPENEKSTTAYTALMAAYFASRNGAKGLKTFKTMRDEGIPVALGTYNVLLAGLEKSGRLGDLELYRKEKKYMQTARFGEHAAGIEETTCNLLFARDAIT